MRPVVPGGGGDLYVRKPAPERRLDGLAVRRIDQVGVRPETDDERITIDLPHRLHSRKGGGRGRKGEKRLLYASKSSPCLHAAARLSSGGHLSLGWGELRPELDPS